VSASLLRELGNTWWMFTGSLSICHCYGSTSTEPARPLCSSTPGSKLPEVLNAYRQTYQRLLQVQRELEEIHQAERDAARRADMLTYQIQEIETARLHLGEEDSLRDERNRLQTPKA